MFSGKRSTDMRSLLSMSGLIVTLLLLLTIALYAFATRQSLLPRPVTHSTSAAPLVLCKTPPHTLGDSSGSLLSGGLKRTFLLHLAPSYGTQPQALLIVYHGYSWTSQVMANTTHMAQEADKAGFVVVFPQGVDTPPSWNAGVGAYGPTGDADDVQFTRDLINYFEQNYCIDAHRIYVNGFSLGGGMAYRVACALADTIAAVATISGAYYPIPGGCQPSRPLPVLEIHGAADTLAPYAGNPTLHMAAVKDYLDGWLTRDMCNGTHTVFFNQGDVTATAWTHCAPGVSVVHYRISDGGHVWPGSPGATHVIDGSSVVWDFLSKYRL